MTDVFLEEYSADEAVRRYGTDTAGYGISYLLDHDYGRVYSQVLGQYLPASATRDGARLLEFGCGAGMNLVHLVGMLEPLRIPLARAYGTDFSEKLIEAARLDAARILKPRTREKVEFVVARNETIVADLAARLAVTPQSLLGSFHAIVGVNTFRYCHRLHKEKESAQQLFDLLVPDGVCIVIDMNAQFPLFRSKLKPGQYGDESEVYIPVLEEYVRPFADVGFNVIEARNFCWVPHSAGPALCTACRILTPALDVLLPRYGMRSLVIAKRPA
jgi:SAM-dependent methyltransferase